ncbi:GNAT family N-acetyltransferase [Aureitalea sp. L0-47]|uniref:GNAT family N-acetyltransferase n=1 Tax=Aureitalea sp. L0-47 TaxID=2816962 RepID=UPI0022376CBE|nr:GNAT family N-acetyltransferase [Aureitalea sp. L0-47]MCW5519597.1 GNAT family N-acetyltransferase [Aureitalea sp. L0-47]
MTFLETARLKLRKYTLEDAGFVLELLNSPEWIANIGDRGVRTLEDARHYIEEKYLAQYDELGFGSYVSVLKGSNTIVGTCGLYKRPKLDHFDIGFALLPKYEKKGYAFEATSALMNYARSELNMDTIYGITLPTNKASQGLLRKLGLEIIDRIRMEEDEAELLLFST